MPVLAASPGMKRAAAAEVVGKPEGLPNMLHVDWPVDEGHRVQGAYILERDREIRGMPVWVMEEEGMVIYSDHKGRWAVTTRARVEQNRHFFVSLPHSGCYPDAMVVWGTIRNGEFEKIPSVSVWRDYDLRSTKLSMGERVQYSCSYRGWVECHVVAVRGDGAVQVSVKRDQWLSDREQERQLRLPPASEPGLRGSPRGQDCASSSSSDGGGGRQRACPERGFARGKEVIIDGLVREPHLNFKVGKLSRFLPDKRSWIVELKTEGSVVVQSRHLALVVDGSGGSEGSELEEDWEDEETGLLDEDEKPARGGFKAKPRGAEAAAACGCRGRCLVLMALAALALIAFVHPEQLRQAHKAAGEAVESLKAAESGAPQRLPLAGQEEDEKAGGTAAAGKPAKAATPPQSSMPEEEEAQPVNPVHILGSSEEGERQGEQDDQDEAR